MKIFPNLDEALREGYEPWASNDRVSIVRRGHEGEREIALVLAPQSGFDNAALNPPDEQ
jgi:hypothetical protein